MMLKCRGYEGYLVASNTVVDYVHSSLSLRGEWVIQCNVTILTDTGETVTLFDVKDGEVVMC